MTNIWKKYRTLIGTSGTKTHKTGITTESFTQCTLLTDKDIHLQKSVFLKSLWTELMYLYHIYMNYSVEIQQYIYPLNLPYMMLWKITSEMVMVKYCLNSKNMLENLENQMLCYMNAKFHCEERYFFLDIFSLPCC